MLPNVYLASGFSAILRYAFKEHILSMCRYVHGRSVKGLLLPRGKLARYEVPLPLNFVRTEVDLR